MNRRLSLKGGKKIKQKQKTKKRYKMRNLLIFRKLPVIIRRLPIRDIMQ